jgi:co-chaperonin GroES (HSP10)
MMQPSRVTRHATPKRRHFQQSKTERGIALNPETIDFIPASCVLKPMRDQMIVMPLEVMHSRILIIPPHSSKLVRGKVLAIGPGHYPNKYNGPKGKRTKMMAGTIFVPTEVKVGDIVHLDGRNTGKNAFDAFYWGERYCIHARQEDVAGIET